MKSEPPSFEQNSFIALRVWRSLGEIHFKQVNSLGVFHEDPKMAYHQLISYSIEMEDFYGSGKACFFSTAVLPGFTPSFVQLTLTSSLLPKYTSTRILQNITRFKLLPFSKFLIRYLALSQALKMLFQETCSDLWQEATLRFSF